MVHIRDLATQLTVSSGAFPVLAESILSDTQSPRNEQEWHLPGRGTYFNLWNSAKASSNALKEKKKVKNVSVRIKGTQS